MDLPELPDLFALVRAELPNAGIARVEAGATDAGDLVVEIRTARPGVVIGRRGATVEALRARLAELLEPFRVRLGLGPLRLSVIEIRQPELEPILVADHALQALASGLALDRALDRAVATSLRAGAAGVWIAVSGALAGERAGGTIDGVEGGERAAVDGSVPAGAVRCEVAIVRPGAG
jgi:small subunit ribosomal protein S3